MAVDAQLASRIAAKVVVARARADVHVPRDEQIDEAVLVDVSEGATRVPARGGHARRTRRVAEAAAAAISVQPVATYTRDVQVHPAVVVIIGRTGAHPIFPVHDA